MDEHLLQRLREQSGLRLDAHGRFWLRDEPIEHARTVEVLHRGLHRAPDGRWATRIGAEWAFLQVDDAAFFAREVAVEEGGLRCTLQTGARELCDPGTLACGEGDALYLRLPGGERARLTRAAQLSLAGLLREHGDGFALALGGRLQPVGRDGGPEPVRRPG